jgi:ribonuclease J
MNQEKEPKEQGEKKERKFFRPRKKPTFIKKGKLRIVAIGGLNEVGKNCMAFEYGNEIVVVDAGMQFPEEEMLGIDFVIPDMSFLEQNKDKIKALVITHAHLDHIGAIPHFLKKFPQVPVIATKLTIGMVQKHIEDAGIKNAILRSIDPDKDKLKIGQNFDLSFFRVNHSIPDGMGIYLKTPSAKVVHTGDFKFDFRPADGVRMDMGRLAEISSQGVDILFADSTNAGKKGYCKSEYVIAQTLEEIVEKTKGRLIIASFSSLIGRIQQIANFAHKNDRKIFVSGRSMIQNIELASNLGYFKSPRGTIRKLSGNAHNDLPSHKVLILTTGSQGESMSALTRISLGEHKQIHIQKGDTVVFSSSPIPGNERATTNVVNNLFRLGAHVITNDAMDVHTSGHAYQEDLKLMQSILKPKYTVPIHGEFYMRMAHKEMLVNDYGLQENQVAIIENGSILEFEKGHLRKSKEKVPSDLIMIDGIGEGDTGARVLRDRQVMSENGVIIVLFKAFEKSKRLVGDPDIISRGSIYMKESKNFADGAKQEARKAFEESIKKNPKADLKKLKSDIYRKINSFIIKKLDREPMIIPVIVYV